MSSFFSLSALLAGHLCYVGYFSRGEHHLSGVLYLQIHTVLFLALSTLLYRFKYTLAQAILQTCIYDGLFLAGLYSSLLAYRIFLNPLNVFPGPWMARVTSFDLPLRIQKRQMFKTLSELHHEHGDFVRIGTQEMSITHPTAVQDIFGPNSKCLKSAWYDITKPQDALLLRRSHRGHAELRRIYSPGFSTKAIRGYEERIGKYRTKLISRLDEQDGKTINLVRWISLYAWDTMGDLTFGHPFGMLDSEEKHWAVKILNKGMTPIGDHLPMWLFRMMYAIPGGQGDFEAMLKYTEEQMLARWENEPEIPDLMSHLFVPYKTGAKVFNREAINLLAGEAHLLMNAANDSTTTTLAGIFFELAQHPEIVEQLRKTLGPLVPEDPDAEILHSQIENVELLDSIIWEGLRLHTPTPSHGTRVTPAEGVVIGGKFIPGGTQVMAPQFVIGRDEKIYPRALDFVPERWYSSPELIKYNKATAPFSLGPYNCIGKPLAMMNMRLTLARIIMRYDLSFAPDRPSPELEFEEGMIDHFTLETGPLYLRLDKRK